MVLLDKIRKKIFKCLRREELKCVNLLPPNLLELKLNNRKIFLEPKLEAFVKDTLLDALPIYKDFHNKKIVN